MKRATKSTLPIAVYARISSFSLRSALTLCLTAAVSSLLITTEAHSQSPRTTTISPEVQESVVEQLRDHSIFEWSKLSEQNLELTTRRRIYVVDQIASTPQFDRIVTNAFQLDRQGDMPRAFGYYREGRDLRGFTTQHRQTYDALELKHHQLQTFSRLLYVSDPDLALRVAQTMLPVVREVMNKPYHYTERVTDDQYAGGDNGQRVNSMTFETFKNLLFAFDRLERMTPSEKSSSRSNQTLHKTLGEFLFSEETIRHFATNYSSWLTDGSRESGEWARKYFDLVQAQRPGAMLAAMESYEKGTHQRLSTLRFWMTRSKEDFRSIIFSIDYSSRYNGIGFLFQGPIGSFDGFRFLRRHPDLIVDVIQIELRKNAPYGHSQGSVLAAAQAVFNIEADTKEHQLVERLRLRSQNAMYLNATINNAYLMAGEPTNSNFFRFGETVTANQEMQKLVSEEMKKLGMSSIDPRKLAKAVSDISKGLNGPHLLSALRRQFGHERIDAIVRASFIANEEFSRRAPMLASTTSTYDKEERMTSTRRSDVRTGALVELLARNQFTLADFDVLVRDLGQGISWINPLVRAYDSEVLRSLQFQIKKLLYEAGYQDGAGLARYLLEKHNLELVMDEKREAAIRRTSERSKAEGENRLLMYDVADERAKLVDRVTKKPGASPAEVLALVGALSVVTTDRDPRSKLHFKLRSTQYDANAADGQIRILNDFIKESLGNWYRQNPAIVARAVEERPAKGLMQRAQSAFGWTKSCEAAFVSTK